jgi:hypothetical protein
MKNEALHFEDDVVWDVKVMLSCGPSKLKMEAPDSSENVVMSCQIT